MKFRRMQLEMNIFHESNKCHYVYFIDSKGINSHNIHFQGQSREHRQSKDNPQMITLFLVSPNIPYIPLIHMLHRPESSTKSNIPFIHMLHGPESLAKSNIFVKVTF